MKRGVEIVRTVVVSALGRTLAETVDALEAGQVGIRTPRALEQDPREPAGVGEVPTADAQLLGPDRAERMLGTALRQLLGVDDRASMQDGSRRWAIVLGTTLGGMRHCGTGLRADARGETALADTCLARSSASAVLAAALGDLPFSGPSITVSAACASALAAMAHGCALLEAGEADCVIAGGYDPVAEFVYGGFSALQLVAQGPLSPFAPEREGMKLGEGIALCVLRRAGEAAAGNPAAGDAPAFATIVATGESSDAHHLTQPHPVGAGAARALAQLDVDARPPELLVAHATGTPGNDSVEYLAYRQVLGDRLTNVPVVALKSRFGHPLGAAGALELFSALGCAQRGFMPTSAGRGRDREAFPDLALLEGAVVRSAPRDIVALAAGFGGANAAIRVRREDSGRVRDVGRVVAPARAQATVCITGAGAVSPAGQGVAALAAAIGGSGFDRAFDEATLLPLLDAAKVRRLALLPRLMIAAVRDLCQAHGIAADELRDTPLVAASWCGASDFTERYYRDLISSGIDLANPMLFAESVPNIGSAQASIALGIQAASISVVGRRTAGLEALFLAKARIASGEWQRAIVVAAEEEHPLVTRVLRHCCGEPITTSTAAVALLLERGRSTDHGTSVGSVGQAPHGVTPCDGRTRITAVRGHTATMNPARAARQALAPGAARPLAAGQAHAADRPHENAPATGQPRDTLISTDSPFDAPIHAISGARLLRCGEIGAAAALAVIACTPAPGGGSWSVAGCDPHGACWIADLSSVEHG